MNLQHLGREVILHARTNYFNYNYSDNLICWITFKFWYRVVFIPHYHLIFNIDVTWYLDFGDLFQHVNSPFNIREARIG